MSRKISSCDAPRTPSFLYSTMFSCFCHLREKAVVTRIPDPLPFPSAEKKGNIFTHSANSYSRPSRMPRRAGTSLSLTPTTVIVLPEFRKYRKPLCPRSSHLPSLFPSAKENGQIFNHDRHSILFLWSSAVYFSRDTLQCLVQGWPEV